MRLVAPSAGLRGCGPAATDQLPPRLRGLHEPRGPRLPSAARDLHRRRATATLRTHLVLRAPASAERLPSGIPMDLTSGGRRVLRRQRMLEWRSGMRNDISLRANRASSRGLTPRTARRRDRERALRRRRHVRRSEDEMRHRATSGRAPATTSTAQAATRSSAAAHAAAYARSAIPSRRSADATPPALAHRPRRSLDGARPRNAHRSTSTMRRLPRARRATTWTLALGCTALVAWTVLRARALAPCGNVPRALAISALARTAVPICFSDQEPAIVVERHRAYLPRAADLHASAARLAHLAHHLEDGSTSAPAPGESCAHWLAARDRRETTARALERDMLTRFGARALPLPKLSTHCAR